MSVPTEIEIISKELPVYVSNENLISTHYIATKDNIYKRYHEKELVESYNNISCYNLTRGMCDSDRTK
jgi:hypothetical protein